MNKTRDDMKKLQDEINRLRMENKKLVAAVTDLVNRGGVLRRGDPNPGSKGSSDNLPIGKMYDTEENQNDPFRPRKPGDI